MASELAPAPVVFAVEGVVRTTSRDVARLFEKRHDNVLRDIASLIDAEPSLAAGGVLNFEETPYVEPSTGQTYRQYEMTRDGFVLLAMGFTGAKALKFKLAYIEAFNRMEQKIREQASDPMRALNDPAAMRGLLLSYSEKVLALQEENATLTPKAEALDLIANTEGSYAPTDAAKTLGVRPKEFFIYLRGPARWIYRRPGTSEDVAYQDKLQRGLMEHKVTTIYRDDGTEKTLTRARITAKGLAHLAVVFRSGVA